jgi:hypothetical protein
MYIVNCWKLRKNDKEIELIHEAGVNMHIHWLNPLLFKRKSKYCFQ